MSLAATLPGWRLQSLLCASDGVILTFQPRHGRFSMIHPEQALADIIDSCQPKALVAFGTKAQELAQSWSRAHDDVRATCMDVADIQQELKLPQVQDLALITDSLEHLSHSEGQTLLGQLRNYGTRQIAVLVRDCADWSLTDFIGLGFRSILQV